VLTKLDQYTFQGSFEGWIRRIVVNTITDHLRKNLKSPLPNKELDAVDGHVNSESVEKLSHKELLGLIQTLPDVQRMVFNLYVFENYQHKEIAQMLNIKENNSRWYLNDARKRLKEKITFIM
jgi:RNA polymerase sigma-70 factor (ECF subfamily)